MRNTKSLWNTVRSKYVSVFIAWNVLFLQCWDKTNSVEITLRREELVTYGTSWDSGASNSKITGKNQIEKTYSTKYYFQH